MVVLLSYKIPQPRHYYSIECCLFSIRQSETVFQLWLSQGFTLNLFSSPNYYHPNKLEYRAMLALIKSPEKLSVIIWMKNDERRDRRKRGRVKWTRNEGVKGWMRCLMGEVVQKIAALQNSQSTRFIFASYTRSLQRWKSKLQINAGKISLN